MLDTVNFTLTKAEVEGVEFLEETTAYLNPGELGFHNYNGFEVATGKLDNLSVSISPHQVRVKDGSMCKFLLGDNYQTLTRADIKRAVERLSDTLHLPFDRAKVIRLDVGACIPVREPTANYFNHLGVLNYAKRLIQPHGLYYSKYSDAVRLSFYDKNRESRDHRAPIPDLYSTANVLRYEVQMRRTPQKWLNVPMVTGAMLYDEIFYISLCNLWRDSYKAIRKINEVTLNFEYMRTTQQLKQMGVLALVEQMGGEVNMIAHIKEAQKRGKLTAIEAHRLIKAVKEVGGIKEGLTTPSEAITELDKKINEVVRFYR